MKFTGLKKNLALLSLSALCAGTIAAASCSKSDGGGDGGSGGDQGGAGGDSGGSGGDGGDSSSGGSGGTPSGGKGGSPNAGGVGGSGGSPPAGGGGGVAMSGGTAGSGIVKDLCKPENFAPQVKDGISGPLSSRNAPGIVVPKGTRRTLAGANLFIPAQYTEAKDGEVAILFASGLLDSPKSIGDIEKLIHAGLIPPTIFAFGGIDWSGASDSNGNNIKSRSMTLTKTMFPAIKTAYPKISNEARMHGIGGQSTAGAIAFDIAYSTQDFFGKVWGVSASFANFMQWLYPYPDNVDASGKDKLRISLTVGECDLVPEPADIPASCAQTCAGGGCIDPVGNNWVLMNKELGQKLISHGYKTRVFTKAAIKHLAFDLSTPDDLTWLFRDIVCK